MAHLEERFGTKLRSTYLSTVISVSLVLFMLGLLGLIILHANKLSDYVKENIGFTVMLKDSVKEADVTRIQKELDAASYVKSTNYITKEQAARDLQVDLGEDFIKFLGYNPLPPSIDVRLNAEYANNDSILKIETELLRNQSVKEVYYMKSLVGLVNDNLKKIGFIVFGFSSLLLLIAIGLINNSIRLSIYSKRFLIKTMLLVGATPSFIRSPFMWRGIRHGLYGAVIAILLLSGLVYMVQKQMPELVALADGKMIITLYILVVCLGVVITFVSTYFAVRKYLRLKTDQLYY